MSIIQPYRPWELAGPTIDPDAEFELPQWPVKLWKAPIISPYYHNAHLLIAADCVGIAYTKLHTTVAIGRVPMICCPESDFEVTTKLVEILRHNDIRSIMVIRMDAPCCSDLTELVAEAIKQAKKAVTLQTSTIFIDAEIVD